MVRRAVKLGYVFSEGERAIYRVTPKSQTLDENVKCGNFSESKVSSSYRSCRGVPNQISWVLGEFKERRFEDIHRWRSWERASVNVTSKKESSRKGPMDVCLDIISKKMADSRMIWEREGIPAVQGRIKA